MPSIESYVANYSSVSWNSTKSYRFGDTVYLDSMKSKTSLISITVSTSYPIYIIVANSSWSSTSVYSNTIAGVSGTISSSGSTTSAGGSHSPF